MHGSLNVKFVNTQQEQYRTSGRKYYFVIKVMVFWNVARWSLAEWCQYFGGTSRKKSFLYQWMEVAST